jgi:hypothetical protein
MDYIRGGYDNRKLERRPRRIRRVPFVLTPGWSRGRKPAFAANADQVLRDFEGSHGPLGVWSAPISVPDSRAVSVRVSITVPVSFRIRHLSSELAKESLKCQLSRDQSGNLLERRQLFIDLWGSKVNDLPKSNMRSKPYWIAPDTIPLLGAQFVRIVRLGRLDPIRKALARMPRPS